MIAAGLESTRGHRHGEFGRNPRQRPRPRPDDDVPSWSQRFSPGYLTSFQQRPLQPQIKTRPQALGAPGGGGIPTLKLVGVRKFRHAYVHELSGGTEAASRLGPGLGTPIHAGSC